MTIRLHTALPARFSDLAEVLHIFYPDAEIVEAPEMEADFTHLHAETSGFAQDVCAYLGEKFIWSSPIAGDKWEHKRRVKRGLKLCCYYLLRRLTGIQPTWGSLTGVRPTRLFYERLARGMPPAEARNAMIHTYDVSESRADLLLETVSAQRGLISAPKRAVDLYIGIPFCTTRCAYCSFFAEAIGKGKKVAPYLSALFMEMDAAADIVREKGLMPRALYIGGGTPTALPIDALAQVLEGARQRFPGFREFTVEAGRPDTIDRDKLGLMRANGVTRISVNPQSMRDETLRTIGRAHTAEDTIRAFYLARQAGFNNINMDLIAALPGEDLAAFESTLAQVEALHPDSITVHTLARKHGSRFNEFGFTPVSDDVARAMVEAGREAARRVGMRPYYLYRQKYVAGNLENVAYALPGKECLYNIDIMEETVSILAMGAGAISKRVFAKEVRIERAPNVGDIGHYLARVDAMTKRKQQLWRDAT